MKFSFEVPIAYLKSFDKVNDYHFILAHLLLQNKDYAKFFKQSKKFKILDNGCAELGKSINTNKLVKLAVDYKADVLVLPDVWMDGKHTFKQSIQAFYDVKKKFPDTFQKLKFMYVPQGKSFQELNKYLTKFTNEFEDYETSRKIIIGLPYLTCAKIMGLTSPRGRDDDVTNARIQLIQKLELFYSSFDVHLLGAGFNFSQEISFMRHYVPLVKTTDTSTPFVLAKENIQLNKFGLFDRKLDKAGTLNFDEPFDKHKLKLAIKNAKILKSFARFK